MSVRVVIRADQSQLQGGHPDSTMMSTPNRELLHKIVILNPKGGAGKTTLATNIASYYACAGPPPTLADCDPQGYSTRWLTKRPADKPEIHGLNAYEQLQESPHICTLKAAPDSRHLIIDLPAALPHDELYEHTYDADSILVPVLPSAIDIYGASRFIAELLLIAQIDRRDRRLAIVANRTRQNTKSFRMLMRFLTSLRIPLIAKLRDSQNYVHAAAAGVGVHEMPYYKVRKDIEQLDLIVEWLDEWRMRKLDAAASVSYEHVAGAEVLTPIVSRHNR